MVEHSPQIFAREEKATITTVIILKQRASLCKEVSWYACADWLKLICRSEGDERSRSQIRHPIFTLTEPVMFNTCARVSKFTPSSMNLFSQTCSKRRKGDSKLGKKQNRST